mmetsp:Transcript_98216/g.282405  ORF Transcript_98216/g.282405 Transcript_98216/m.282405 type:complete len:200 (+) Transcript_98216:859-1458(+)
MHGAPRIPTLARDALCSGSIPLRGTDGRRGPQAWRLDALARIAPGKRVVTDELQDRGDGGAAAALLPRRRHGGAAGLGGRGHAADAGLRLRSGLVHRHRRLSRAPPLGAGRRLLAATGRLLPRALEARRGLHEDLRERGGGNEPLRRVHVQRGVPGRAGGLGGCRSAVRGSEHQVRRLRAARCRLAAVQGLSPRLCGYR